MTNKPATDSGFVEYGKKLEALGKKFQNPSTRLEDLFSASYELGLIISFRVEPDPGKSVDVTVDIP